MRARDDKGGKRCGSFLATGGTRVCARVPGEQRLGPTASELGAVGFTAVHAVNPERKLLTRAEFAKSVGRSKAWVTKMGHAERLVLAPDGNLVDIEATLARLEATGTLGFDAPRRRRPEAAQKSAKSADKQASASPTYWTNKSHREGAMAELAVLEVSKRRGELVEAERVRHAAFAVGRLLRDSILALPAQLAPELAVVSDQFAIEQRLRQALRRILDDLAKMSNDDLARALKVGQ